MWTNKKLTEELMIAQNTIKNTKLGLQEQKQF